MEQLSPYHRELLQDLIDYELLRDGLESYERTSGVPADKGATVRILADTRIQKRPLVAIKERCPVCNKRSVRAGRDQLAVIDRCTLLVESPSSLTFEPRGDPFIGHGQIMAELATRSGLIRASIPDLDVCLASYGQRSGFVDAGVGTRDLALR